MIPVLFLSTATSFNNYGVGALSDAISCEVEEHRNGSYELTMEYPITGIHFDDISLRSLILAKPNYLDNPQPFRVYQITKPINGKVTIYARHWSYDLSDIPVQPFTAAGIQSAMNGLISNAMYDITAWSFTTTRTTASSFKVDEPSSVRSWFGGKAGSLLDVYGGEWHYDGRTCSLENSRGTDRGVVIRYGVNLTELKQEENCNNVYTGVLAFWKDMEGNLEQGTIQNVSGTFDFTRIFILDCSEDFEEAPTTAQLNAKANAYIANNDIGVPKVNLTLNFAQLGHEETTMLVSADDGDVITDADDQMLIAYESPVVPSTRVDLCDTVTVVFEKLGVQATAKCIRVRWNTLLDRYEEVELGDAKSELTEAIIKANAVASSAQRTAVESYQASIDYTNAVQTSLQSAIDSKVETWFYAYNPTVSNAPASGWDATQKTEHIGDLFYNTSGHTLWRWTGSAWSQMTDAEAISAAAAAAQAQSTADGKISTYYQSSAPTATAVGDLWIDTDDENKPYRWSGSAWVLVRDTTADTAFANWLSSTYTPDLTDLQTQVDGKVETWFYGYDPTLSNAPASTWNATQKTEHTGDLFFNTTGNTLWRWTGSLWQRLYDQEAIDAATTASEVNYLGYHLVIEVTGTTATSVSYEGHLMKGTNDVTTNYDDEDFLFSLETEDGTKHLAVGTVATALLEDAGYGGTIEFIYNDETPFITLMTADNGDVLVDGSDRVIYA